MAFPVPSLCFHSQKQKTFSPWHHAMETSWLRLLSSVSTAWDCVLFLITGEYHNSYTPVFVFSSCLSVIPSSYVDKKPYRSLALNLYIPIWPTMDSGGRRKTGRLCETFSFFFFFQHYVRMQYILLVSLHWSQATEVQGVDWQGWYRTFSRDAVIRIPPHLNTLKKRIERGHIHCLSRIHIIHAAIIHWEFRCQVNSLGGHLTLLLGRQNRHISN